jgi:hypothetical protein
MINSQPSINNDYADGEEGGNGDFLQKWFSPLPNPLQYIFLSSIYIIPGSGVMEPHPEPKTVPSIDLLGLASEFIALEELEELRKKQEQSTTEETAPKSPTSVSNGVPKSK